MEHRRARRTFASGCLVAATPATAWLAGPVFVRTPQRTIGGDSGGPVWTGAERPVGIHKGGSEGVIGIGQFSVYSKLGYRPSGVTLK